MHVSAFQDVVPPKPTWVKRPHVVHDVPTGRPTVGGLTVPTSSHAQQIVRPHADAPTASSAPAAAPFAAAVDPMTVTLVSLTPSPSPSPPRSPRGEGMAERLGRMEVLEAGIADIDKQMETLAGRRPVLVNERRRIADPLRRDHPTHSRMRADPADVLAKRDASGASAARACSPSPESSGEADDPPSRKRKFVEETDEDSDEDVLPPLVEGKRARTPAVRFEPEHAVSGARKRRGMYKAARTAGGTVIACGFAGKLGVSCGKRAAESCCRANHYPVYCPEHCVEAHDSE
jgi:hypothetical protein